jgi:hypothetical protein
MGPEVYGRATIRSSNLITEYISRGNEIGIWERYLQAYVCCSSIQNMEST